MDKIWLKHYPANVPATIDYTTYSSLPELLEEAFQRYRARTAYSCLGQKMSYQELDQLSQQMAAWLQQQGLAKGARVALMMPNVLQYPIAIAAVLRAGYVVMNVNPLYTPRELEHQLNDSGAEAIVVLENFAATLQNVIAHTSIKRVIVASLGELLGMKGYVINLVLRHIKKAVPKWYLPQAIRFKDMLRQGAAYTLHKPDLTPEDIAFLQYTGGTTGVAKGAMLLHRNMIANVLQSEAWMKPALIKANTTGAPVEQIISVCALPLYHIFSLMICAMLGARTGALNILIPNPRDIGGLIKQIAPFRVNLFPAVNTLFNGLLNHPHFAQLDFSGLRVSCGGGMAVQQAVAQRWKAVTGCAIAEGYGLSETSPSATSNPTDTAEYTGTIGMPLPSTEVVLLDDAGNVLPLGSAGEIAIRGPQVMAGYWQRPDETAEVMTADGFFKTGDIGVMDERGYIKIIDRKKDMISVSGFKVFPNEIEQVVNMHPGVLECACIGIPDANSGEAVKLFVVKKDPHLTEQDLLQYCKEQFTGYKRPKQIEFRSDLPKSNVGKILRRELRDK